MSMMVDEAGWREVRLRLVWRSLNGTATSRVAT